MADHQILSAQARARHHFERIRAIKDRLRQIAAEAPGVPLRGRDRDTRRTVEILGRTLHALEDCIPSVTIDTTLARILIRAALGEYERGEEPHREWDRAMLEDMDQDDAPATSVRQVLDRLEKGYVPPTEPPPQPSPITVWTRPGANGREGTIDGVRWFQIPE